METKYIFETVVYDGARKVWRILNLKSGTVYSSEYETEKEAYKDINDGEKRIFWTVYAVNLHGVHDILEKTLRFYEKSSGPEEET